MKDTKKNKAQLIAELEELRKLNTEFEAEGSTFKFSALDKNFQALLESTDDYILISDKNGLHVIFNSSYRKIMKEAFGIDMKPGLQPHKLLPDKKIVRHSRYVTFQMAEVAIDKRLFAEILSRIERLRCYAG